MSAASVISWMLARSPRPSAISRAAASMRACRVRALRRSSRFGLARRGCRVRHRCLLRRHNDLRPAVASLLMFITEPGFSPAYLGGQAGPGGDASDRERARRLVSQGTS